MAVDIESLKCALMYNPETGELTWRLRPDMPNFWNTRYAGKPAFNSFANDGYKIGGFNNKVMLAHRVIFAIMTGQWPKQVDHINGVRHDNRWTNLREATNRQNGRNQVIKSNNTSGHCGVSWRKDVGKWAALITFGGEKHSLGHFRSKAEAVAARKAAEIKYGFDPMHGSSAEDRANRDLDDI